MTDRYFPDNAQGGPLEETDSVRIASTTLLDAAPAVAGEETFMRPEMMQSREGQVDWMRHTEDTLAELKAKLNLSIEQMPAWDVWSHGVLMDAHQQLDRKKPEPMGTNDSPERVSNDSTPEQMKHGIERLRTEIAWMQQHVVQLEAALARTTTFYAGLNTNQKTIFDLFWHEMHHRMSGRDHAMHMPQRSGGNCAR